VRHDLATKQQSKNVYTTQNTFRPKTGFSTGLWLKKYYDENDVMKYKYEIYSLNTPSIYHREYYIFLIRGYNPVTGDVYVYSI
jgi:hypothetical protein